MKLRILFDAIMNKRVAIDNAHIITREDALRLCRKYGNFSLAHSTVTQTMLQHFGDKDGYIAFAVKSGFVIALGDPVCRAEHRAHYLHKFIAATRNPSFMQISFDTARILSGLGFPINGLGLETHLSLKCDMFSGSQFQTLRYSASWLVKRKFEVIEVLDNPAHLAMVADISEKWRTQRIIHRREMSFLNRPFTLQLSEGMRRYLLIGPDGDGVAFLDLDPLHQDGTCIGFTTSFKRRAPSATAHAEIGLTKLAAEILAREGFQLISLGLSPLANHGEVEFRKRATWHRAANWAFSSKFVNQNYFNLQGHSAFKRRFHGLETPSFMAIGRGGVFEAIAQLRLIKLI